MHYLHYYKLIKSKIFLTNIKIEMFWINYILIRRKKLLNILLIAIKIIILLGFLIFIHELGHFTVAKLCKVKVNEFSIGFGPTIWKKQGKETKYAIRLIPLGGFVSMEGEEEQSENEGSFSKASIPKRIAIVVAGATVNIIFGVCIYFILAVTSGPYLSNEIDATIDNYAAKEAGLQSGDKIIEVNGKEINSKYDLDKAMKNNSGENVEIKIQRGDETEKYSIKPTEVTFENNFKKYYLGINMKYASDNFANRCINGVMQTNEFISQIGENLKQLFTGKVGIDQMTGPVGISEAVAKTNGFREFLQMMALISISLGVTNLLPVPALDGGKILILIIEAIRRKPMKQETELGIQMLGFALLIGLSVVITYNDILRIF